jgi:flagellar motor switch protein FliG
MEDKIIVLTMYGKDKNVENISISLFDKEKNGYYSNGAFVIINQQYHQDPTNNVVNYCNNINELELKDNHWISAQVIYENQKIALKKPPEFDIIDKLTDPSLQKVIREVDKIDLAKVLKGIDERTKERVFKNMSPRAAAMLKEDIEALREASLADIKTSKKKIVETILHLHATGEIVLAI